jgi:hypothetical protein
MQSSARNATYVPMLLLLLLAVPAALQAQDWKAGDVFLGIGGGQIEVFRPSAGVIETPGDGVTKPGPVNSSFIDNTWHLWTSDPGAKSNQSKIVRFTILPPQTAFQTIDASLSCSGLTSSDIQSITIDGKGDIFAANASPATIVEFDSTRTCVAALALPVKTIQSIDLSTDGKTLWFTSGNSIGQVSLPLTPSSAVSTLTLSPNVPGSVRFFDLRVVPAGTLPGTCNGVACPTDDSLLVVAQGGTNFCNGVGSCVLLVDTGTGAILTKYTIPGQNGLQALTLDPIVQVCGTTPFSSCTASATLGAFWVAPASNQFFQVSVTSGAPSNPYNAGPGVVISSLFVYSGFGANESIPTEFSGTLTPDGTTASGTPMTTPASFAFPSTDANTLTATEYGTPGGTALGTTVTVFASTIDQTGGANDAGQKCTVTVDPLKCIDWEVETSPTLASDQLLNLQILAPSGGIDPDTRMFRDESADVTISLDITSGTKNSLYSLNEIPGNDEGCAYLPSTQFSDGAVINPNRNSITFRFQCSGLPGSQLAQLLPRISVTQLFSPPPAQAPAPYFPGVGTLVGGTCCGVADYRYDSSSNTWVINVSFKGVPAGTEFDATTFDDNHIASAFHISFFLGTSTQ